MKITSTIIVALGLCFALTSITSAQSSSTDSNTLALLQRQGGGRGGMRGGPGSELFLLMRGDVQKDLKLTDDQIQKFKDAQASMRASFQGGQSDPAARKKNMEAFQASVKAILTPEQSTRLAQISLQIRGMGAATDPKIQKEIGVTPEQATKLKELETKLSDANKAVFEKVRSGDLQREDAMALVTKNNSTMNDEIEKLLTSDEKEKLKAMWGVPFVADPPPTAQG